ncbi:MAG: sugar transferase [Rikenellaceae bacterium]
MYNLTKRTFDIVASTVGLVLLFPVLAITWLIIILESRGGAFFVQERLGKGGKPFKMYKFRSMVVGAESQGTGVYSFKGDARVTKVGRIIRATSIDELPQFINIIKGDMSLVGPRPVLTYHPYKWGEYPAKGLKRFEVRPGVTGWAQINGRKTVEWDKRFEYDGEYVERQSFGFDLKIIFLTVWRVVANKDNENR